MRSILLPVVFAISGFAALLYQIIWQRLLFTIYGINIESVTLVVTSFMVGLGVGGIIGGLLSRRPRARLVLYFAAAELVIGTYGLASLSLFRWAGGFTANLSYVGTAIASFLLVIIPTTLMGATLPMLVAHMVKKIESVGESVGLLYFVNTLGSAVASIAGAWLLLGRLGTHGTVMLAAACNFSVALLALVASKLEVTS